MTNNKLKDAQDMLNKPCTITEAAQIASGVVSDAMANFNNKSRSLQVAISLQIEILKSIVIESGLITEEEFRSRYMHEVEEFNKMQSRDSSKESGNPKMGVSANTIEVKKEN